jgi:hypothetical protein
VRYVEGGAIETYVIMDVFELRFEDGDWIEIATDTAECWMLVSAVMNVVSTSRKATKRCQYMPSL